MTETSRQTRLAVSEILDEVGPWLTELGNWIFGALIGFNLVLLGAALTIGPVSSAVKIAIAATAMALPPSAVGLLVLRFVTDVRGIRASGKGAQALHDAGLGETEEEDGRRSHRDSAKRKRSRVVRRYSYWLFLAGCIFTLVGLTSALWYGGWWIAVAFLVVLGLSLVTLVVAVAHSASIHVGRRGTPAGEVEPPKGDQPG